MRHCTLSFGGAVVIKYMLHFKCQRILKYTFPGKDQVNNESGPYQWARIKGVPFVGFTEKILKELLKEDAGSQ